MDLTFFSTPNAGSSTLSPTLHWPRSAVPVTTVPWPRIGKQWSIAKKNGPSVSLFGTLALFRNVATSSSNPMDSLLSSLRPTAATFSPPTQAAHATTGASRNFDEVIASSASSSPSQ